jgi:hypothetical protein
MVFEDGIALIYWDGRRFKMGGGGEVDPDGGPHRLMPFEEDLSAGLGGRNVALKFLGAGDPEGLQQKSNRQGTGCGDRGVD